MLRKLTFIAVFVAILAAGTMGTILAAGDDVGGGGTVPPYTVWLPVVGKNMLPDTGCLTVGLSPEDGVTVDPETVEFQVYMVANECNAPGEHYVYAKVYVKEMDSDTMVVAFGGTTTVWKGDTPLWYTITTDNPIYSGSLESGTWYRWAAVMNTRTSSPSGGYYEVGSYWEESWHPFYVP